MVVLMCKLLTFCQFFLRSETRKLIAGKSQYAAMRGLLARRTQHDVPEHGVLGHLDVADGDTEAQHLLQLELDGRADLGELVGEVLGVRDGGGEFSS
jgi:hypothetical protein